MDNRTFDILTDIFESPYHDNIIDYDQCEISKDDDHLYYTLVFNKELTKDDIDVTTSDSELIIEIKIIDEVPYVINTIYPILPKKSTATLHNNILDITLFKDKTYKYKEGYSESEVVIND